MPDAHVVHQNVRANWGRGLLSGEVGLVTDAGQEVLRAGDCAVLKGGAMDGHCFCGIGARAVRERRHAIRDRLLCITSLCSDDRLDA
jgi:uncharacterized cupin superfamily protein